ncbi:hypothetical protein M409DRAFT_25064 [Zasmidium cellare ATCC 36951]|uniref:Uncharacterized protein n=1 Tax=Zasmidium cellare ATCC 36951 TaxID=1080233 RepID=A0A6A6CEK8_ZASCE|nr:uncharacterized protein M409DRAFT_25064 [Zasmidium cellare ATCC 36951]KAF2164670.1 hypothetical protein M409DRAFT_25064 [Zasmidium cellare ATCC 36951]
MSASRMPQTIIDLTGSDDEGAGSPSRQASSASARAPKREASAADHDEAPPHKRPRTGSPAASPADQLADTTAGATASTEAPRIDRTITRKSALDKMKQRAPRYLTTWSSEEGVEFKNPDKFCIKPPFYIRWQPHDYINLAEHIRYQFDPIPFARAADKPVEEVNIIAARLICNPLYDAGEAMKRGQEGIDEIKAAFRASATPSRPWANRTIKGELDAIKTGGELRVICDDGSLEEIGVDQLDVTDTKYLDSTLSKGDWMLFYGRSEEAYDEMMGKNEGVKKNGEAKKRGDKAKTDDEDENDNGETDEDQADEDEEKTDDDEAKRDASKRTKGKGKEAQPEKQMNQARSDEASKKRKRDV